MERCHGISGREVHGEQPGAIEIVELSVSSGLASFARLLAELEPVIGRGRKREDGDSTSAVDSSCPW